VVEPISHPFCPRDSVGKQLRDVLASLLADDLGEYRYRVPGEDIQLTSAVSIGDTSIDFQFKSTASLTNLSTGNYITFQNTDNPLAPTALEVTSSGSSTVNIVAATSAIADSSVGTVELTRVPSIRVIPPQIANYWEMVPGSGVECVIHRDPVAMNARGHGAPGYSELGVYRVVCDQHNTNESIYPVAQKLNREFRKRGTNLRVRPQEQTDEDLFYARATLDLRVDKFYYNNSS
jgi:hypothetical protein